MARSVISRCLLVLLVSSTALASPIDKEVVRDGEYAYENEDFPRRTKSQHSHSIREDSNAQVLQFIHEAIQSAVQPVKKKVHDYTGTVVAWWQVDDVIVTLDLQPYVHSVTATWQGHPAATICSVMRLLAEALSQVLQLVFARSSPAPGWLQHKEAVVHWLDEYACAEPLDLNPTAVMFFFSLIAPALLLRPRWYLLGALLYGASAVLAVAALGESLAVLSSNKLAAGMVAGAHLQGAVGLLLTPVFAMGLLLCVIVGVGGTLLSTIGVLVFGTPSFWLFVFSPIFFIARLTVFNPYTAVPGVAFTVLYAKTHMQTIFQAFVVRSLQPFVRAGVFCCMLVNAAWLGEPSDLFAHFKWMWRFHAMMWGCVWWAPAWLLGVFLYAVQLGWGFTVLSLLALCLGFSLPSHTGAGFFYLAFAQVGCLGSMTWALGVLAQKGVKVGLDWRAKKLQEQAEKEGMIKELGYVPLSARDLAKNPGLLQQQFQQRAQVISGLKRRK